jgi:hypothetical protein
VPSGTLRSVPDSGATHAELRLAAGRPARARVDRRGHFRLRGARVACRAAGPCVARATVVLPRRSGRRLGAGTLRVAPGRTRAVAARLTRYGRSLLARRKKLRVHVQLTLSPGRTRTVAITLLTPRRRP